jgi:iron complex transport system permease protein
VLVGTEGIVPTSIVTGYRLPRALAAVISGAAMAVSGLQMQTLLRNPLAGPWILGVVGSARLGVAFLLVLSSLLGMSLSTTLGPLESSALAIGAIVGAAVGMSIIAALSRRISAVTLLITGVIATYMADSGANFLVALAPRSQKSIFTAWNDGSFDLVTWPQLRVFLLVVIVALIASVGLVKVLDALMLGDRYARSLGHSVTRARYLAVMGIVVLAGSVTAFCGPIAFIDIAVPHLARGLLRTASHKALVPATAVLGSLVALAADLATSLPGAQQVLHINHVSAVIGGPVILWILLRRSESRQMQI